MSDVLLGVRIRADGSVLVNEMRDAERGVDRLGREVGSTQRQFAGLSRVTGTVGRGLRTLGNQVFSLKGLLASLGVGLVARSFVDAASTSEQYRIRLTALLGSVEEGNRLFAEMNRFAGQTPFEFEAIMGAATQLAGVVSGGVDEVTRWMPIIGDLAAVSGLSIQETTDQVVRMMSAGAASADLFRERGILAMLGFQAGVSYSAEETQRQLIAAWEGAGSKFRGTTDELAGSWDGAMSMLADKWFQFRTIVMDNGVFDYLKSLVAVIDQDLGAAINGNKDRARDLAQGVIDGFEAAGMAVGGLADVLRGIQVFVKSVEVGIRALATALAVTVQEIAQTLLDYVNFATNAILSPVRSVLSGLALVSETAQRALVAIEDLGNVQLPASFTQSVADEVAGLNAAIREWHALVDTPMPSDQFEAFMGRVRTQFERTREASRRAGGGQAAPDDGLRGGGAGGAGSASPLDPVFDDMEVRTKTALDNVLEAFRNTHQQMNAAQASWAGGFTNTLVQALTTGQAAFSDFARQVIADLARIWVQANITAPLFGTLFAGPGATSGQVPPDDGFRPMTARAAPAGVRALPAAAPAGGGGNVTIYQTIDARGADPAAAAQLRQVAGRIKSETEASILSKLSGSKRVARAARTF